MSLAEFLSMRIKVENFALFALFLLAWHIVFSSLGLYSSKRFSSRWAEVFDVVKAAALGSAIVFVAAIFLRIRMVTPLFILFFWVAATLAGVGSRVLVRSLLAGIRRRGRNLREMVVVGTNPRALRFARKIEASPELGYRIAGFVDGPWLGLGIFQQTGYPLVADFAGLPALPPRAGGGRSGDCAAHGILLRAGGAHCRALRGAGHHRAAALRHFQPTPGAVEGGRV